MNFKTQDQDNCLYEYLVKWKDLIENGEPPRDITIDGVGTFTNSKVEIDDDFVITVNYDESYASIVKELILTGQYKQLQQLKDELHQKVEFIQEQRNIIDAQNKEIEMYKNCQGSRASKREEQLKEENEKLKKLKCDFKDYCTCNTERYLTKLKKIKEIMESKRLCSADEIIKIIEQEDI